MITPNDGEEEGNSASNLKDKDAGKNTLCYTSRIPITNRTGILYTVYTV